jgi:hypothetical protein
MSDGPKTAKQHNAPLTGEATTFSSPGNFTIASGMAQQMAWQREHEERQKISAILRRFVQDELIIQQATAEIYKALRE